MEIMVTSPGTIMVERMTRNSAFLPLNSRKANAYAAITEVTICSSRIARLTTRVLRNCRTSGVWVRAFTILPK